MDQKGNSKSILRALRGETCFEFNHEGPSAAEPQSIEEKQFSRKDAKNCKLGARCRAHNSGH